MTYIYNYTPYNIVINIKNTEILDHSNLNNYKYHKGSIYLKSGKNKIFYNITKNSNLYIMSQNCKYFGHFPMNSYKLLPNTVIYIGLVNGYEDIKFINANLVPSDINFGLAKLFDSSSKTLPLLNPYVYLVFIFILLIIIFFIIKYAFKSRNNISNFTK